MIIYKQIKKEDFNINSLNDFVLKQVVKQCWRKCEEKYKLMPVDYVEDWTLQQKQNLANKIILGLNSGDVLLGAKLHNKIIAFAFIKTKPFGKFNQYIIWQNFMFLNHLGQKLFKCVVNKAKLLGANKLYISAHSAEDTIAFYKKVGCKFAEEINNELVEKEPLDLQLEYEII